MDSLTKRPSGCTYKAQRSIIPAALGCLLLFALQPSPAQAGQWTLQVGPPSVGNGGSNPVGIPPGLVDIGFLHAGGDGERREIGGALSPALLLWGYRQYLTSKEENGPYVAFGGAIVSAVIGLGPGVYTALGSNFGCALQRVCVHVDLRQTLGLSFAGTVMSPFALRVGITVRL